MSKAKKLFLLFIFYFLVVFVFYFPAQNAKFVNDTFYYLYEIETTGWKGILWSYHMIFLWYLPSLAYCILYKLFGLHWLGWHIVFCVIHSMNALLLFILLNSIFSRGIVQVSLLASFLFLMSPFQTEVVAWGAALHYLLILLFLLSGFLVLLKYFETLKIKYLVYYHLLFACSLSCFEQAFFYPFAYGLFVLLIVPAVVNTRRMDALRIFLWRFFSLNILFIAAYFFLTKLVFGEWIAHYGATKHINISLKLLYSCFLNYNWKFLFFYRYLPFASRQFFERAAITNIAGIVFAILFFLMSCVFLKKKYYATSTGKILLFLFLCYFLMLLPVLNLDQSFVFEIQSDRYGYIASAFFYPLLAFIAYKIFNRSLYVLFATGEIIICATLLINSVHLWHRSGDVGFSLLKSYPLRSSQKAYILNLPDNYKGAYVFRNGFSEGLGLFHHNNYRTSVTPIAMVNIYTKQNETDTRKINDSTYCVRSTEIGKWYYFSGHGSCDYKKENYTVDFDEWNTTYTLTITKKPEDTTYVLQCYGDQWKIIDTLSH
ncbi:MAG: hypothetical protein JWN78_1667 [Bacteroidota bacterium]|nr:hypothetical protein [Bacteroidota bacterium]